MAAQADLVFTVETAPGCPETVTVPAGTPVQSVPGPGQLPQTFETSAELELRGVWNSLAVLDSHAADPEPGHQDPVAARRGGGCQAG